MRYVPAALMFRYQSDCRPLTEVGRIRIQNRCRAAVTGKFVLFDSAGVAGLVDAVAASCAVPGGMAAF